MKTEQTQIHEFMVKAQQVTPDRPTLPEMDVRIGRLKWLAEELCELANAWGVEFDLNNRGTATENFAAWPAPKPQFTDPVDAITEAYDASLDLMVFAVGNGVASGTELQPGWDEVHASNMSKFIDGYRREDGKWMKGPSYRPANLRPIIEAQLAAAKNRDSQQSLV
jgi:predicted HAD superfamily Cof-like phosphohydrolase